MKPIETINLLIAKYPELFKNRFEAVMQILFTGGNGYEWKDGEIIYFDNDKSKINTAEDGIRFFFDNVFKKTDVDLKYIQNSILTFINVFNNEDDGIDMKEISLKYISENALIFSIPENITKEWRNFIFNILDNIFKLDNPSIDKNIMDKLKNVYDTLLKMKTKIIKYEVPIQVFLIDIEDLMY